MRPDAVPARCEWRDGEGEDGVEVGRTEELLHCYLYRSRGQLPCRPGRRCRGRLEPLEVVRDVAAWRDAADGEWHG